ncbi:MAG: non-homologous end-joining DNA ligase [Polyangiaceae bacterium]
MPDKHDVVEIEAGGHAVRITHPEKPYFAELGITKLDIVRYFLAVAEGALRGIADRPVVLKRFVDGASAPPFYQKRAPAKLPSYLRTVELRFPSGRTADEIVVDDVAGLIWIVNLGCMELHPHPVRSGDLEHPDELRVDLDPGPGVDWPTVRAVALEVRALLTELGLEGWPKTSGSRGMHILVRIEPRWSFTDVRRAAFALAREVERRAPSIATAKWWKEERHGVFLDYNQNAKDRTTCSAYSIRPLPDARVSAPLSWEEVATCEPGDFTMRSMPARLAALGDLHAEIDRARFSIERLLEWAARDESDSSPRTKTPRVRGKSASHAKGADSAPQNPPIVGAQTTEVLGGQTISATGRRASKMPLLIIANAALKEEALAGLERWKTRHAEAAAHLAVEDILVDTMRGRSSTWVRIRINLRNVPEALRPPQETPDPNLEFHPWKPPPAGTDPAGEGA